MPAIVALPFAVGALEIAILIGGAISIGILTASQWNSLTERVQSGRVWGVTFDGMDGFNIVYFTLMTQRFMIQRALDGHVTIDFAGEDTPQAIDAVAYPLFEETLPSMLEHIPPEGPAAGSMNYGEHTKGKRPSTEAKHQEADARRNRDQKRQDWLAKNSKGGKRKQQQRKRNRPNAGR